MLWCVLLLGFAALCDAREANIINGKNVDRPGKYPWQVSLQQRGSRFHFCGGSIVAPRWIVTASHCLEKAQTGNTQVTVGLHDQNRRYGTPRDYAPRRFILHRQYKFPLNDIALIELSQAINYNQHTQPIALARNGEMGPQHHCVITGWGNTIGHQSSAPNTLQETDIKIVDRARCRSDVRQNDVVCLYNGRSGSCQGDSGGPLACWDGRQWKLAGATSWGLKHCPVRTAYSVYADVGYFYNWIMSNSGNLRN